MADLKQTSVNTNTSGPDISSGSSSVVNPAPPSWVQDELPPLSQEAPIEPQITVDELTDDNMPVTPGTSVVDAVPEVTKSPVEPDGITNPIMADTSGYNIPQWDQPQSNPPLSDKSSIQAEPYPIAQTSNPMTDSTASSFATTCLVYFTIFMITGVTQIFFNRSTSETYGSNTNPASYIPLDKKDHSCLPSCYSYHSAASRYSFSL